MCRSAARGAESPEQGPRRALASASRSAPGSFRHSNKPHQAPIGLLQPIIPHSLPVDWCSHWNYDILFGISPSAVTRSRRSAVWSSCAGRRGAMRDHRAWRASLSQMQVILCLTAWVGVLIVAAVVIRIVFSSALPLLSAQGARWVVRLVVASIVSGTIYGRISSGPSCFASDVTRISSDRAYLWSSHNHRSTKVWPRFSTCGSGFGRSAGWDIGGRVEQGIGAAGRRARSPPLHSSLRRGTG